MPAVKPTVRHWRTVVAEDTTHNLPGWYCWFYAADLVDIDGWMKDNMVGYYDCTFRFNSGNPMYTIFIQDDEDANFFKMSWL